MITSCVTRDRFAFSEDPFSYLKSGTNNYLTDFWWQLSEIMHIMHMKGLPKWRYIVAIYEMLVHFIFMSS